MAKDDDHPLIKSAVFYYKFDFIHPCSDGNGRMIRLWKSLILKKYREIFKYLPIENIVYKYQQDYYNALQQSTKNND